MPAPNKITQLTKTEKTALILEALRKEGYSDYQVSQLLDVSRPWISQVNKKLQKGELSPLVTKAKKALALLIEGQVVGNMKEVKGADVLNAVKQILDREMPIINKTETTNVSMLVDLTNEDREKYRKVLGIIDAEFEVLVEPKAIEAPDGRRE